MSNDMISLLDIMGYDLATGTELNKLVSVVKLTLEENKTKNTNLSDLQITCAHKISFHQSRSEYVYHDSIV